MQPPSTQTVALPQPQRRWFFSRASSPPSISWLNSPIPVVNDGKFVVEKTVFGILSDTRQLWVQLLCGETAQSGISAEEAQSFISNVVQRCINLMNINNGRELMTHALGCIDAWLRVRFRQVTFSCYLEIAHMRAVIGRSKRSTCVCSASCRQTRVCQFGKVATLIQIQTPGSTTRILFLVLSKIAKHSLITRSPGLNLVGV